ncbi:MAG: crotonase/enoyl-CoA hydratase family protein [Gammaproteobacteria bacterium]|nr:MAG: crotonase/enoyl-CoA hydratase family protein [Gammaproteobacteria bacterium]
MSIEKLIKVEKENHITTLTLNHPDKLNVIDLDGFKQFIDVFTEINMDPDVWVVVIKGEGRCFTAGIDLKSLASLASDGGADSREHLRKEILGGQESMSIIESCTKPVIAAIHGYCLGAGVDLISACDIRIASKDALFGIREAKMAVIADLGTLQRLPHIIGQGWTRELALTGRDFSAEEALQMGLVTRVCESKEVLFEEADKLAQEVTSCAPLTIQGTKDVLNYSRDNGVQSGLQYVAQKNAAALISEDLKEAITAVMQKRKPAFKGK